METRKTLVTKVICEKCHSANFKLYHREDEPRNYFLTCPKCGATKEFRVFLVWDVEAVKVEVMGELKGLIRPPIAEPKRCDWLMIEPRYKCTYGKTCPYKHDPAISCPIKEMM